jgi:hypothetical protein
VPATAHLKHALCFARMHSSSVQLTLEQRAWPGKALAREEISTVRALGSDSPPRDSRGVTGVEEVQGVRGGRGGRTAELLLCADGRGVWLASLVANLQEGWAGGEDETGTCAAVASGA